MAKIFEASRLEMAKWSQRDNVVDRGTEDAYYERNAHWNKRAPSSVPEKRSTQSRPSRPGTLFSALNNSVPDDIQPASREKILPEIKYDNETEVQSASERPKRSTRAKKALARSPTPEIEKYSVKYGLGEPWDQPVVYPGRDKTAARSRKQVSVEFDDLCRLDEGEWLNDSLVEYCLLRYQQENSSQASKVYFFSNFFYSKLVAKPGRNIDYEAVRRWVKKDIFTYDFVVVPVCENAHWYLVLICNLSRLERRLADDDADVVEEVKVESLEHEGQPDTPATTSVPEDTAAKEHDQTHQVDSSKSLNSPSEIPENKVFEEEDAMDLVGTKTEDAKQTSELKGDANADSVSDNNTKGTSTQGTKKKTKRHPTVRRYAPDTPAIAILDSMPSGAKHGSTINALKDFLVAEANFKRGMKVTRESLQGMHVTRGIPMQDNFSDCGLFLCRYVRELLKDPEGFSSKLFNGELDKIEWDSREMNEERATIRNELQALAAEQSKQRKDAKAEKRKSKRAAPPNVTVHTATEASTAPLDTPANLPPSSPTKASSPVKGSSPVRAPRPLEAVATLDSAAKPRDPPRSPVRFPNPVLQSSPTPRVSKILERGGSEGPRFSARSSPADHHAYSAQGNGILIHEDDAGGVVSERQPQDLMREDSEDYMLHDQQAQEGTEEEPEFLGFSDDEQAYQKQLLEAVMEGGETGKDDDDDDVEGSATVSDTPAGSPKSWEHPSPATRSPGSQNSQGFPATRYSGWT